MEVMSIRSTAEIHTMKIQFLNIKLIRVRGHQGMLRETHYNSYMGKFSSKRSIIYAVYFRNFRTTSSPSSPAPKAARAVISGFSLPGLGLVNLLRDPGKEAQDYSSQRALRRGRGGSGRGRVGA